MRISVVVPFHNVAPHVEACLQALLAQDYPEQDHELILVDNNSSDGSADLVRRHPRVRLLCQAVPGAYAARNLGVAAATGEVIAFTDADCAPARDWLRRIADALADPAVMLVQGRRGFALETPGLSILSDYEAGKAAYTYTAGRKEIYYGFTNNMAVRRTLFDLVGPFPEVPRGADVVLVHRAIESCSTGALRFAPEMRVRHLEITSVWRWFAKMHLYGRSYRFYSRLVASRPLSASDRLQVLRATLRQGHYPWPRRVHLALLLGIGLLYYELGRRRPGPPLAAGR